MKKYSNPLSLAILISSLHFPGVAIADFNDGATAYDRKNYKTALQEFTPLGNEGNAAAQFKLGWMYINGLGVQQDSKLAASWFRMAANQGYVEAINSLEVLYRDGQGVLEDTSEAIKYGDMFSNARDGRGVPLDYKVALKWYRLAANKDDANAQDRLGLMYMAGQGTPVNKIEAKKWFQLAAEQGHVDAKTRLQAWPNNPENLVNVTVNIKRNLDVSGVSLFNLIEPDGTGYKLSPTFFTTFDISSKSIVLNQWPFNASSLNPIFPTARFECVINNETKIDGCKEFKNKEDKFIYINSLTSSYGDTPAEKRIKEEKEANTSIAGKVVGGAALAGGSVIVGLLLIPFSPFYLLGKATEKETKKWVEFNHDDFAKAVDSALKKSGFSNRQEFLERKGEVAQILARLEERSSLEHDSFKRRIETERDAIAQYARAGFHSYAYEFKLKRLTLPDVPVEKLNDSTFEASAAASIEPYYAKEYAKFSEVLTEEKITLKPQYEAQLKQDSINEIAHQKQAKLDDIERIKQAKLTEVERVKQAKFAAEELRKRQQLEDGRQSKFRKGLKLGDDTFCGPVIDVRGPMIKVAVNVPLPGYASEVWLKIAEIFTPDYGCSNTNGRLSPNTSPY